MLHAVHDEYINPRLKFTKAASYLHIFSAAGSPLAASNRPPHSGSLFSGAEAEEYY